MLRGLNCYSFPMSCLGLLQEKEDEVFGTFLNKKKVASAEVESRGCSQGGRAATWKLRKWTRGKGYSTVVVGMREGEEAKGSDPQGEPEVEDRSPGVPEASLEVRLGEVLATYHYSLSLPPFLPPSLQLSVEDELQGLSQGLKIKDSAEKEQTEDR